LQMANGRSCGSVFSRSQVGIRQCTTYVRSKTAILILFSIDPSSCSLLTNSVMFAQSIVPAAMADGAPAEIVLGLFEKSSDMKGSCEVSGRKRALASLVTH